MHLSGHNLKGTFYSFDIYLLSAFYVLGIELGLDDLVENKTDTVPIVMKLHKPANASRACSEDGKDLKTMS